MSLYRVRLSLPAARFTCSTGTRIICLHSRFYASKPPSPPPPSSPSTPSADPAFQTQLWDSTYQRIQRERADRERYYREHSSSFFTSEIAQLASKAGILIFFMGITYYFARITGPAPLTTSSTMPIRKAPPLQHDTRNITLQAAWHQLGEIVGSENVTTDEAELLAHASSAWSSHRAGSDVEEELPFMVVRPASTDEVARIMQLCHAKRIPITPYAGGTSLEGSYTPTRGGVCIDFSRMNKVVQLHADDLDVVVQPGLGWEELNEELAKQGLMFPPDPGPGAQIGGMIGTGCSGTNAFRYGTMKDWVLGLTVVLADGTVIKTRQRPRKSSAGYDLTRLFIGSEGTLGIVTEAALKIIPKPEKESVAVCTFKTIGQAADAATRIVRSGIPVAAIELLDDVQMKCINDAKSTSRQWSEQPTLFLKFAGSPNAVSEQISQTKRIVNQGSSKSSTFEFARNQREQDELWAARKAALWSVLAKAQAKPTQRVWTTDVTVPLSQLSGMIDDTKLALQHSGLLGTVLGHVGDGNFHAIIVYDGAKLHEKRAVEAVVRQMMARAIEVGGTCSGEHGVGLVKRMFLQAELGEPTINLMRKVKLAMDPLCLLNCDKVVAMGREKRQAQHDLVPPKRLLDRSP